MSDNGLLQDKFLGDLCKDKAQVSIFLVNGIKLHGVIDGFDAHVIMLKGNVTQMVFKRAIYTVVPATTMKSPGE